MVSEKVTSRHAIVVLILFIFGSSVVAGVNTEAKQDSWIALIAAVFLSIPILLIYARIIKLYPGLGLYEIVEKLFGKIGGKIITLIMAWYSLHLGAIVLRNFSEYINITTLLNTPQILIVIMLLLVTIYIARSGPYILGSWSIVGLMLIILMVLISVVFSFNRIDIQNIFPIMGSGFKKVTSGTINIISFPFAETVLLLPFACFLKKSDSPYKIYMYGLLFGGIILLIIIMRNLTVLGADMMYQSYFPSFTAARVIEVGNFLTRVEGLITINFIIAGITKITVCLISFALAIARILSINNYKRVVMPSALLFLALSTIIYNNTSEMKNFTNVYPFYAATFQLIIPLIIWITAEIKKKQEVALIN
ncbi:MAG: endospore germination permease [Bacilli bacterium]|nr:endospore germination permease [Bacilli bacterium]